MENVGTIKYQYKTPDGLTQSGEIRNVEDIDIAEAISEILDDTQNKRYINIGWYQN
jgi:hypothetical protein